MLVDNKLMANTIILQNTALFVFYTRVSKKDSFLFYRFLVTCGVDGPY